MKEIMVFKHFYEVDLIWEIDFTIGNMEVLQESLSSFTTEGTRGSRLTTTGSISCFLRLSIVNLELLESYVSSDGELDL